MNLEGRFRRYLLNSGLQPGDRIHPELELAERFAVSRGDIRKVLTTLCQEGVLERRPRVGTTIRHFDAKAVSEDLSFRFQMAGLKAGDALEARRTIELAILPLVILRINSGQLQDLRALNRALEEYADRPKRADRYDRDLHLGLLRCCGNYTLQSFAEVITGIFRPQLRAKWHTPALIRRAVKEHRALLNAIENQDLEEANDIISKHLSRT